jgi:hypothetical protein
MDGERIILELVPLADSRPVEVRLRLVLKQLLRAQGFRCMKIDRQPPDRPAAAGEKPPKEKP